MKKILLATCSLIITFYSAYCQDVYPTNWWVGMKNNSLQLMIHQEGIASKIPMYKLSATGMKLADGVTLKLVRRVASANYIFLDLVIDKNAKPGIRKFAFGPPGKGISFNYELKPRSKEDGKTRTQGISSKDFIYLIMPDRFANGDPSNDIITGYRDEASDRSNKFSRHGGDLKGIENHFDYLRQLGVTAIWLTPVIENDTHLMHEWGNTVAGYHGYWFTNQYQVDKRFGGNDGYLAYCEAVHRNKLKVIQDAVYNHVSKDHFLVLDPPAQDWINNWPTFTGPNHREEALFDPYGSDYDKRVMIDGWFTDHLPDLNLRNPLLANFLIQHAVWSTELFGIDAWRVDTYKYCDEQFMNNVNAALYREFPGMVVFGEAVSNTVIGNAYFTQNNINGGFKHNANGVLDFQTSYSMLNGMGLSQGWNDGVNKIYTDLAQDLVYKNPLMNCIFLDNHDMDRVYSVVGEDWAKLRMGINWLLTLRGIPQLYYGTEILMKNLKNPSDALVREDFPGGWPGDKQDKFTVAGRNENENAAFDYVSRLANFRKGSSALTTGKTMQFIPRSGVYAYFRYDATQTILVITNTGAKPVKPDWQSMKERTNGYTQLRNVVTNTTGSMTDFEIAPKESFVFLLEK